MKSAINNITRRGAPPFVALLGFIVGAYLRASLLHSAGADLPLRTRYKLHDLRRMPPMPCAPGRGKAIGRMSALWPCFREIPGGAASGEPLTSAFPDCFSPMP